LVELIEHATSQGFHPKARRQIERIHIDGFMNGTTSPNIAIVAAEGKSITGNNTPPITQGIDRHRSISRTAVTPCDSPESRHPHD
jgi:hypothetical protein